MSLFRFLQSVTAGACVIIPFLAVCHRWGMCHYSVSCSLSPLGHVSLFRFLQSVTAGACVIIPFLAVCHRWGMCHYSVSCSLSPLGHVSLFRFLQSVTAGACAFVAANSKKKSAVSAALPRTNHWIILVQTTQAI